MRVFVLGAGVSKTAGYPLGAELFDAITDYVRSCGPCIDRFDYVKDWNNLLRWLNGHKNPLVAQAHRRRLLEYLFTLLDIGDELALDALDAVWIARQDKAATARAERDLGAYKRNVRAYGRYRRILLLALRAYLEDKHHSDRSDQWQVLHQFGEKLHPGDVVITFNYDATIERVLFAAGKWTPVDGFGFGIACQRSVHDASRVDFPQSSVKVLHLHGAVGWYRKPTFRPGFDPTEGEGGAIDPADLAPGPRDTEIAVAPAFFEGLGIAAVDAAMPSAARDEDPIYLHPSFIKDYEQQNTPSSALIRLWQMSARMIREASEIFIIGYSLPKADSAALTLLLTNTDRERVTIVNQCTADNHRLRGLLSARRFGAATRFEQWVGALA